MLEFDPWNAHGGRKKPNAASCPLPDVSIQDLGTTVNAHAHKQANGIKSF